MALFKVDVSWFTELFALPSANIPQTLYLSGYST
jgi:hypothetical protein